MLFLFKGTRTTRFFGSQPNIAQKLSNHSPTNPPKITPKLTKAQSFKHQKSEGSNTPKLFKRFSFKRNKEGTPKASKKPEKIVENQVTEDFNRNDYTMLRSSKRDVTSALVDCKGGRLVNDYWGVSLEIPENAIPQGVQQEIYFVISDPRLCDSTPPLDLENGNENSYQCTYVSVEIYCALHFYKFLVEAI